MLCAQSKRRVFPASAFGPMLYALVFLLALNTLAPALVSVTAAPAEPLQNAILLSWDGVQREHLYELLRAGRLPNLQALVAEGTLVDIDVTAHPTDTKAGHAQMLTGYGPSVTGVFNNQRYRPIPRGLTIFERLEKELGESKIATIMITGKGGNLGSRGCSPKEGEPFYHTRLVLDFFQGDKGRPANEVGRLALKSLDFYGRERFFAFFHFGDPDAAGHRYGENSPQYEEAIMAADRWLGQIVEKLKGLGIYEETRIYVTSDHGFDEGQTSHRQAPRVFLATNDLEVKRGGDQGEIALTILSRMGLDPARMIPPFPGRPLTER